jgi:hypothetical protein
MRLVRFLDLLLRCFDRIHHCELPLDSLAAGYGETHCAANGGHTSTPHQDRSPRMSCAARPGESKFPAMSHLSTPIRLIAPATIVVLLGGCSSAGLSRTFGLTRDAPDEFTVVTRAPLSMPPDFTLRPPQPGVARPQEQSDRSLAESALVPEAALGGPPVGMTAGQAALVRDAGGGAPADIRQRVDQEARLDTSNDTFIDRLLYWRKADSQHAVVDPTQEAKRLRDNAAMGQSPENGDTPMIREKKTGWFQDLFSWL